MQNQVTGYIYIQGCTVLSWRCRYIRRVNCHINTLVDTTSEFGRIITMDNDNSCREIYEARMIPIAESDNYVIRSEMYKIGYEVNRM